MRPTRSPWRSFLLALAACAAVRPARAQEASASEAPPQPTPRVAPAPLPRAPNPGGRPAIRVDGGYARRWLFDLPITSADVGAAAGARPSAVPLGAFWGSARFGLGSTESGLSVWSLRAGAEAELVLAERVRFGLGASALVVGIKRQTRDASILSAGVEARATARIDVVRTDDFAFFLRGAFDAGFLVLSEGVLWGPTVGAGFDFDLGLAKAAAQEQDAKSR